MDKKIQTKIVKVKLENSKVIDLPIIKSTMGPDVIDVRELYEDTGYLTYDPGFLSTGSCESKITFIDGEKGILLHRGYTIEDLAKHADFMEVSYLLLYGELPNPKQKQKISIPKISKNRTIKRLNLVISLLDVLSQSQQLSRLPFNQNM